MRRPAGVDDDAGHCTILGLTALLLCLAGFASFLLRQVVDDVCLPGVVVPPPLDRRAYRHLELDNGLSVLVVSDPDADVAAAAVTVGVGSLSDPEATPGLAHFLEHMLFTGNAQHPREGEYFEFVSGHGGYANAATGPEATHFHLSVPPAQLLPALERLLAFFIAPTLAPAMSEREKHAVSAEHAKNVGSDEWRFERLRTITTGNPACALRKFATGDLETLANASSAQLRAFYAAHYVPSRMGLAVVGSAPLPALAQAVARLASAIPRGEAREPDRLAELPGPLAPDASRGLLGGSVDASGRAVGGRLIYFEPVADVLSMRLLWYLPSLRAQYAAKSLAYLTQLLGDEGAGSLVSLLRGRLGWVDGLSAGGSHPSAAFSTLEVSLSLTQDGLQHAVQVVQLVLAAIERLRDMPAERWRWEEARQLAAAEWRFLPPADAPSLAQGLSASLLQREDLPLCDALRAPYAFRRFDAAQIAWLAGLLRADSLLLYIGAKGLADGKPDGGAAGEVQYAAPTGWVRERHYGLRFSVAPFPPEMLEAWARAGSAEGAELLALPEANPFVPTDFTLAAPPDPEAATSDAPVLPRLLASDGGGRLWLYADRTFAQPRAAVTCVVTAAAALEDSRALWATELLAAVATDALQERAYPAYVAGLGGGVGVGVEGVEVQAAGFSQRLLPLLRLVAASVGPSARLTPERFERVRAGLLRELAAERFRGALPNALSQLKQLTRRSTGLYDRLGAAPIVANLSLADVRAQAARLASGGSYTECLAAGNVREVDAREALASLRAALGGGPPLGEGALGGLRQRVLSVPVGAHLWEAEALDPDERNSAVALYFEVGSTAGSLREEACLELLLLMTQQAAFDQLRTVEQLGYSVGMQAYRAWSGQAALLYAQSDSAPAEHLDERFEAFLRSHEGALRNTTAAAFEGLRAALLANLGARDLSLGERSARFWSEIQMHACAFDRGQRLLAHARELTLDDVLALYERTFLDPRTRRKLGLRVRAPGEAQWPAARRGAAKADRSLAHYTARIPADGADAWRAGLEPLPAPTACAAFAPSGRAEPWPA